MRFSVSLKNKSGIYAIRNRINSKVYIGRSKCFYRRFHQYKYAYIKKDSTHLNDHLRRAFDKYGFENFAFEVIEYCPNEITPERELYWMEIFQTHSKLRGYNLRKDVNGKMITSPETSIKIRKRLKEEWTNGIRSGHSEKLKKSWNNRDRNAQSKLMSRNLTKYIYQVFDGDKELGRFTYSELKSMNWCNVISNFHRKKSNIVSYKNLIFVRRSYED